MTQTPTLSHADRFALIVDQASQAIDADSQRARQALMRLIFALLRQMAERLAVLLARYKAGELVCAPRAVASVAVVRAAKKPAEMRRRARRPREAALAVPDAADAPAVAVALPPMALAPCEGLAWIPDVARSLPVLRILPRARRDPGWGVS